MTLFEIFRVGDHTYSHHSNDTDDSVELHDEDNKRVLMFDSDAFVHDEKNTIIGKFRLDGDSRWVYIESSDSARPDQTFGRDLLEAEIEISKQYIQRRCERVQSSAGLAEIEEEAR